MEDFDLNIIAEKSVKGIIALVSRTFLIQILGIVSSFALTIFLSPSIFGVFFIVSSIVIFLNYFSDFGLAASLIQKKEEPDLKDFRTVFTVQQFLVFFIVIVAFLFSPIIASSFHLKQDGLFLLWAFLISFVLSSLRTIPTIILERKLDFQKLVLPEIGENLVYNLALIILAYLGFGIKTFTIAVLLRSIVGLVIIYIVQPWKIGFAFDREVFRKLLSFGLPFQANSILALFKDNLINVYIGKILPLNEVGYIGFAQKWAFLPLRLILDNVIKIIFPSFSRLQHDKASLKILIEKSLFILAFFILPIAVGFITLSKYLIEFIPRYQKWEPALISLGFFALNSIFGSLSAPLTNFLNAIGRVKTTLYLMIFWTALIWILTPIFINLYGYNGVSIASFLVAASTMISLFFVRKHIEISFFKSIYKPFVASLALFVFIYITQMIVHSLLLLVIEIIISGVFYFGLSFILSKSEMLSAIRYVRKMMKSE